jgi:hypothetical protein
VSGSAQRRVEPNRLSWCPLYLEAFSGNTSLATATGFTWEEQGQAYLITNWHVLSGRRPDNGQPVDPNAAVPDRIEVHLHVASYRLAWRNHSIALKDADGRPLWLEHPQHGRRVDVAVLPFACPPELRHFPINAVKFDDIRPEVTHDVFVLGFPLGITSGGRLPIWKRGSIASEPDVNLYGLPQLLIDTATREGMSGAPVIAQFTGYYSAVPGVPSMSDWVGSGWSLLGVYSGRYEGRDPLDAQLGIVWKKAALLEILAGGIRPD